MSENQNIQFKKKIMKKELTRLCQEDHNFTPEELRGPRFLESEVVRALDTLKNGNIPGQDDVYAEIFKQVNTKILFNKIYNTGRIFQDVQRLYRFKKGSTPRNVEITGLSA